ncbi:hypothetical protein ACFOW1_05340 [Parasediminibacterium paludis]|uniref:TonB C-terminal domain-containing protein n=1 Tax=Parasediminibacterium paludis TaxID=908966 RepID=A0ABV8PTT5_9BACT
MTKLTSILVTLLLTTIVFTSYAQKGDGDFYAFDENFKTVNSLDVATYFLNVRKDADSVFVCRYYQKNGPMLRQETYKDKTLKIKHGRFVWYNEGGKVDSTGIFVNGLKDGDFDHYDDTLGTIDTYAYKNGLLEFHKDHIKKFIYYANGNVEDLNLKSNIADTSSKIFTTVQIESEFNGGQKAWSKYVGKNFAIPKRYEAIVGRKGGRGKVTGYFTVDKIGKIGDVWLARSCEWSVDIEAIKVFKNGPDWTPAIQNGVKVKSRKRQDISFIVDPY